MKYHLISWWASRFRVWNNKRPYTNSNSGFEYISTMLHLYFRQLNNKKVASHVFSCSSADIRSRSGDENDLLFHALYVEVAIISTSLMSQPLCILESCKRDIHEFLLETPLGSTHEDSDVSKNLEFSFLPWDAPKYFPIPTTGCSNKSIRLEVIAASFATIWPHHYKNKSSLYHKPISKLDIISNFHLGKKNKHGNW